MVLIDESGDAGFKLVRGSSSHFVVAMVVFDDFGEAERTSTAIADLRTALRIRTEFKFSKSHDDIKDAFFDCVCRHRFSVRALVVDKSVIYSDSLRERKDLFYNYFVLQGARIKIDGSGDRHFKNELNSYLRQQLHAGQVKSIRFAESHRDNLIQLADMVAGAILRSYRDKVRKDAKRWRQVLARNGKLGDVWDFR
ncbi:MAG: DUF3800 domain-containing protein [Gammaproteobacteria bacterium HGW-Gammaproteobacteria-2]|nr:MAG: DUF3800 domain-containing protein [Gammaproteobacteria bacterium HGW-Gammaproteobacteria-2]